LDNNGCITREENIIVFLLKKRRYKNQRLLVNATITEEGTGFEVVGSGTTKIERTTTKLIFVKADSHFKRGIPFVVKVCLEDIKGTPMPNEQVFIKARELGYTNVTTTDQHGLAEFSINTSSIKGSSLNIKIYHKEESSCFRYSCIAEEHAQIHHVAHSVYSNSWSYVYIETEAGVLPYTPVKGDFVLEIPVDLSMAPEAKILIYAILPDGEMIADSAKLEIEKCLLNKVDLTFTPAQSLPTSQAHLRVTASPQSLCGLRAVDQSVLLLKPEAELSPSWIYNLPDMQPRNFIPSPHQLLEEQDPCEWDRDSDGLEYLQPNERDAYSYVEDMGLTAFTNLKIKYPKECFEYDIFTPMP
ncbi:hypothetical protein A6R68_13798, partial [Neotoma lepida]